MKKGKNKKRLKFTNSTVKNPKIPTKRTSSPKFNGVGILKKKNVVSKENTKNKSKLDKSEKIKLAKKPIIIVPDEVASKKSKKTSTNKMYFTEETERNIILYNKEESQDVRNDIYNNGIRHAFDKLVENIFNTFKFIYFDNSPSEIKKETVTHLVSNMHKFEEGKGKAFSYFSIVAKNYLILHNNGNYKRFNQHISISETPDGTTICLQSEDAYHKNIELSEFMKLMIEYWEKNVTKIFTKERDLNIANAVIELFRNGSRIESFNKKSLYLNIRVISSCKTQQITKVINKMKQYQSIIAKSYLNRGNLQPGTY